MRTFSWRGEPIADIEVWATERGEGMVIIRETRKRPMPAGDHYTEVEVYAVPDSIWKHDGAGVELDTATGVSITREIIGQRSPRAKL